MFSPPFGRLGGKKLEVWCEENMKDKRQKGKDKSMEFNFVPFAQTLCSLRLKDFKKSIVINAS
jgi:hypothetical protein